MLPRFGWLLPDGSFGPQPLAHGGSTPTVQVVVLSFSVDGHRATLPLLVLAELALPELVVDVDEPVSVVVLPAVDDELPEPVVVALPEEVPEGELEPLPPVALDALLLLVAGGGLLSALLQPAETAAATKAAPPRTNPVYRRALITYLLIHIFPRRRRPARSALAIKKWP